MPSDGDPPIGHDSVAYLDVQYGMRGGTSRCRVTLNRKRERPKTAGLQFPAIDEIAADAYVLPAATSDVVRYNRWAPVSMEIEE